MFKIRSDYVQVFLCNIMVKRCCVPGCKSSLRVPNHRIPKEDWKAQVWLSRIGLNNMIDAPSEEKTKLRICSLHFADETIVSYGQKRCLMDNAMPTLYLSNVSIAVDCASTASSAEIDTSIAIENSENVRDNSNFEPVGLRPGMHRRSQF